MSFEAMLELLQENEEPLLGNSWSCGIGSVMRSCTQCDVRED
jgi:hypothetical protein